MPAFRTVITEEHMAGSRGFVADLASLIHTTGHQGGVLPEINIGVVARGTQGSQRAP
jgi:hypothetical protein